MKSANPSTRVLRQRICSIDEKEKKLRDCHYVYCEKAKISFDNEEQVAYLTEKTDFALDCTDACTIFIDDIEAEKCNLIGAENLSQLYANTIIDDNFAGVLASKISGIVVPNEIKSEGQISSWKSYDLKLK